MNFIKRKKFKLKVKKFGCRNQIETIFCGETFSNVLNTSAKNCSKT